MIYHKHLNKGLLTLCFVLILIIFGMNFYYQYYIDELVNEHFTLQESLIDTTTELVEEKKNNIEISEENHKHDMNMVHLEKNIMLLSSEFEELKTGLPKKEMLEKSIKSIGVCNSIGFGKCPE